MTPRMSRAQKLWMAERAVVLQVLRDDHSELWTLEELTQEIEGTPAEIVREAMRRLATEGVVMILDGEQGVKASKPIRHVDELELVSI